MNVKRKDRRTERTQAALLASFVELLLTRGYEPVTVEDIVAHANVGRSTFYVHFKSKEALLKKSLTNPSLPLAELVDTPISVQTITKLLQHFHANRRLNRLFFAAPIRGMWTRHLAEMIEPRLSAVSRRSRAQPLVPLPLAAHAIAEAQLGLVTHWLLGRAPAKVEAIAEVLAATTKANVSVLLNTVGA